MKVNAYLHTKIGIHTTLFVHLHIFQIVYMSASKQEHLKDQEVVEFWHVFRREYDGIQGINLM